jgi:hypothetical protein
MNTSIHDCPDCKCKAVGYRDPARASEGIEKVVYRKGTLRSCDPPGMFMTWFKGYGHGTVWKCSCGRTFVLEPLSTNGSGYFWMGDYSHREH